MKHTIKTLAVVIGLTSIFAMSVQASSDDIVYQDWTAGYASDGYPVALTMGAQSSILGLICRDDKVEFIFMQPKSWEPLTPKDNYKLRAQIDANEIFTIVTTAYSKVASVLIETKGADGDGDLRLVQQLLDGVSVKVEVGAEGDKEYFKYSLMGLSASFTKMQERCSTWYNSNNGFVTPQNNGTGFIQPTTVEEYNGFSY